MTLGEIKQLPCWQSPSSLCVWSWWAVCIDFCSRTYYSTSHNEPHFDWFSWLLIHSKSPRLNTNDPKWCWVWEEGPAMSNCDLTSFPGDVHWAKWKVSGLNSKEGRFFPPTCVINIQDTVEQQWQWCRKGFLPSWWEAVSFDQITKLLHAFDLNVPTNLINTYIWILKRIYFFPSINVTWRFSSFHLWLKSEILHSKSILTLFCFLNVLNETTLFINSDADRDPRQSWSLSGTVCLVAHFRCLD